MSDSSLQKGLEPNPALRILYNWFFDAIHVDETWVREVRELARRGSVVYVLRNLSPVDFLALDHLTKRYDLPKIRFVNDLRLGVFNPIPGSLLQALSPAHSRTPEEELHRAIEQGGSAALFLKRPPSVIDLASGATGGRGMQEGDELMRTLIDMQPKSARPILLLPQVFLWTNQPDTHGTHFLDAVFGPREWPSTVRTMGQFLYNYKNVRLRAGEPLDLHEYLESHAESADENHVRRVTYTILRRLERERRAVTGPAQTPPDRQRQQVLRSPKLQKTIAHLAGDKPGDRYALASKTLEMIKQMQATPDPATVKALELLLDRVFNRVYAGIDIDQVGLEAVREKCKEATLILLPSHKSHIDYLVLSYIFKVEQIPLPMIAAGDNLSFFPLGSVLRRAGGFFIRRKFSGDKLYSAAVEAYVRRLIRDGHTIELFIEGARSRTGKLLRPKVGLLSMLIDAALAVPKHEVVFVPICIGYERIVETGSYGRELTGAEKQKEDAAGLLKSTEVLRHRYGRVNVQFGAHLTIQKICQDLGYTLESMASPARRRAVVMRVANRAMDEMNRVTAVTPGALTALALLSDERRSLSHEDLLLRCQHFLNVLASMGARITPRTADNGQLREDAVEEALQMFAETEMVETHHPGELPVERERRSGPSGRGSLYRIPERKRIELDVSKNIVIHFFVERALVSIAMLMRPGTETTRDAVRDRVNELSKLFKYEFRFRADADFDAIFAKTITTMIAAGELVAPDGDLLAPGAGRDGWSGSVWLRSYAAILRNFVEAYRIAARGLLALHRGVLSEKELLKRTLATGHRMYLSDEIARHEAVSKPILENALQAFTDEGYLRQSEKKYTLTESFNSPEAVRAIEGRIAGYLNTPVERAE